MPMDKEKFEELSAAYVLNALEENERREFEQTLKEASPDMQRTLAEMRWTALHLAMNTEMVAPSATVKESILRTIQQRSVQRPETVLTKLAVAFGFHRPHFAFSVALALLLGLVGLFTYSMFLRERLTQRELEITTLQSEVAHQQHRFAKLEEEYKKQEAVLQLLQSPKIEVVLMGGLEVNPAGYGKVIWDPVKKTAILQISNLPPVPQDKDYQLWVIKDKKPISAGVFSLTDPEKEQFFKIEQLVVADKKVINAFAITLEPKGGVPQPTGAMYLIGSPSL
jgi:anti-sigma-K factor RskA